MLVKIINTMLENTYTTDELVERLGLMRLYYDKYLFQKESNVTLRQVIEEECDEHTLLSLEKWNSVFGKENIQPLVVYEALEAIQEDVAGLPAITLYVPVRFTPEQVEKLGTWFRDNVQPNMLMSLRVDPRATGGCGFIWKSVYHDFSLRYFISKYQKEVGVMFDKYIHAK